MIAPDAPHANARSYAWLDAATGSLLRFEPYAASSTGNKVHGIHGHRKLPAGPAPAAVTL